MTSPIICYFTSEKNDPCHTWHVEIYLSKMTRWFVL